jgi:hypothetical protein
MEKWKEYVQRYDTILAFLGLEILALTAFALGGANGILIFRMIGFFIALAMIPFIEVNHSRKELKGYLITLIPLFVFAILGAFSSFWVTIYGNVFSGIVNDLTVMLGIVGFFIIGYGLKNIKVLKMDWIMLVLGGALGLFVFISTIYSLARYGFFYAARFSGMVYYYQGAVFNIAEETKILNGFAFSAVSLKFGCISAFLLASALPACLYVSPKKDLKRFLIILGFGLLGLISLAVIPYLTALKFLIPIYLFAIVYRFIKVKKEAPRWLTITGFVLMCLVVLGLLILFIDAFSSQSFLAKLPLVGRYFGENGFFGQVEIVISRTFFSFNGDTRTGFNILGFLFGDKVVTSSSGYTTIGGLSLSEMLTRSFEFNVLFQNGFIAFVALVIFIFMMFVHGRNYLAKGEGELSNRMIPVLMLLGGFLYLSLLDDETPMVYTRDFLAATRGSQFYLLFLLAGLVFSPKAAEPVAVAEKTTPAPEAPKAAAPKEEKTLEEVPLNENK